MSLPKPYYEDPAVTIYHGDCREILPLLPKVDLVLTDPPYGINENGKQHKTRGGRDPGGVRRPVTDYGDFNWDVAQPEDATLASVIAAGRLAIVFGANHFGLRGPGWVVWDKEMSGDFSDCELAWTNCTGGVRKFKWRWNGMMQEPGAARDKRLWPTQKPLELMKWCIDLAAKKGPTATILDPFMGSGSTLRAAKDMGRAAIGIDKEERACEIAARRMEQEVLPLEFDSPVDKGEHADFL